MTWLNIIYYAISSVYLYSYITIFKKTIILQIMRAGAAMDFQQCHCISQFTLHNILGFSGRTKRTAV